MSELLPDDPFDQHLSRLLYLPNGAHTNAAAVQAVDFYGKTTSYMVQTVRTDEGDSVFLTQINAAGSARYVLPPDVLKVIDRQRQHVLTQVRRRHGRRLAEERAASGAPVPGFTPEMRAKAAQTRAARALKRRERREKRR